MFKSLLDNTFQSPIILVLKLIIPIVDYGEDMHGWSKLLNLLNLLILPQMILMSFGLFTTFIGNTVPTALVVFIFSIILDSMVWFTSSNNMVPNYHFLFAVGSFAGSILVIYHAAKEIVCVMAAVGIVSNLSDSMVGLSLMALGNSVGDLFSNIALAQQGYQQMAFSACFGGPMFSEYLCDCICSAKCLWKKGKI